MLRLAGQRVVLGRCRQRCPNRLQERAVGHRQHVRERLVRQLVTLASCVPGNEGIPCQRLTNGLDLGLVRQLAEVGQRRGRTPHRVHPGLDPGQVLAGVNPLGNVVIGGIKPRRLGQVVGKTCGLPLGQRTLQAGQRLQYITGSIDRAECIGRGIQSLNTLEALAGNTANNRCLAQHLERSKGSLDRKLRQRQQCNAGPNDRANCHADLGLGLKRIKPVLRPGVVRVVHEMAALVEALPLREVAEPNRCVPDVGRQVQVIRDQRTAGVEDLAANLRDRLTRTLGNERLRINWIGECLLVLDALGLEQLLALLKRALTRLTQHLLVRLLQRLQRVLINPLPCLFVVGSWHQTRLL